MNFEFNNRISAQRAILRTVNQGFPGREQLFGLSSKAIDRWVSINCIAPSEKIVGLLREASSQLFFLANKSQQQVSDGYSAAQSAVAATRREIERELRGIQ